MIKRMLFLAVVLVMVAGAKAQIWSTSTGKVSFFSKTPMENIDGTNIKVMSVLNSKREMAIIILNTNFDFPNKLMQEHFNEKYVESDKFPNSTFKGRINEEIDLSKDGDYKVTVTGKLNIHGVEQERTVPGTVSVKGGNIQMTSTFKVKNADHKIEIPTIVSSKIAEELDVNVELSLAPKK